MDSEKLVDFFTQTNRLKRTIRYSSCPKNVQEPTAGHSWHVILMVPIIAREFGININIEHAMEIACVHDLAESVLKKDFDSYLMATGKLDEKEKDKSEEIEMTRIKEKFSFGERIYGLWKEYQECKTPEAKFVKALDKLESHFHIIERGGTGDNADDGAHQVKYADTAVKDVPELEPLLKAIKEKLKPILEKQGVKWKKEYDYSD